MKSIVSAFLLTTLAFTLLLTSCGIPFCTSTGDKKLAPVLKAIAEFQQSNAHLPRSLDDLQNAQPAGKKLDLQYSTDVGRVWTINYEVLAPGSYRLEFNHAHCTVRYVDGKRVASIDHPFR